MSDDIGTTALNISSSHGYIKSVKYLLEVGANPNISDDCGYSPLINSSLNYNDDIIEILINAGAFTHTSISIRDALIGSKIPFVELHISNIFSREEFRKESFLTDKAIGIISGFGITSYFLALEGIIEFLSSNK